MSAPTFEELVRRDWLEAFVQYASYGEASPKIMYWVGVSTLAAVLQRKVWINQVGFQWTPNFYILIVGEPGTVRKSTSIDMGMSLLRNMKGVNLGPSSATWQAFVERCAQAYSQVTLADGEIFEQSCITLPLSEFGTFFDPENRELVDVLTDLWDGRLETFEKVTKTAGTDAVVNPWINLIAATTPKWIAKNFSEALVGGGFASRCILLHGEMSDKDVAYPIRHIPAAYVEQRNLLLTRLEQMLNYSGNVQMTEAAYEWGEEWYRSERDKLRKGGLGSLEAGFEVRKQGHLHKLATVISASRGMFPLIDVEHMEEAHARLLTLREDTIKVFSKVGMDKVTSAAQEIVQAVMEAGPDGIESNRLYRKRFFPRLRSEEFDAAVRCAVQAELIYDAANGARHVLVARVIW